MQRGSKLENVGAGLAGAALLVLALGGCGSGSGGGARVATSSGATGGGAGGGSGTGDTVAVVLTPERPVAGTAVIHYLLADPQSDLAGVQVEYSPDGGASWLPATPDLAAPEHEGTAALSTSPLGARHAFAWDTRADLGNVNNIHARLRVRPHDGGEGTPGESEEFAVVNLGRQDPDCAYDARRGVLVLSADMSGGFVPYSWLVNHVVHTKIYGDGKVVFRDPQDGDAVIYQGQLTEGEIVALFKLLAEKGFWSMQANYRAPQAPTDLPSAAVLARLANGTEKVVSSYGGQLSAPPGYMEMYDALHVPRLRPHNVVRYIRQPITQYELNNRRYDGEEYQKKLDTPLDWVWVDAGPGGRSYWHKP